MQPEHEPPQAPRRSRPRILVLAVAVVVIVAAVVVGLLLLRPWTIAQVFGLGAYQPGAQITVAGTITGVYRENTSYGPQVSLQLDGDTLCAGTGDVFGDPNATFRVGEAFQTVLHFRSYTINGDPAVSAPELACPFPLGFTALGHVLDAVSVSAGLTLVYNGTGAGGWLEYTLVTANGAAYNPSVLPVTLRKSLPAQGDNPQLPARSTIDSATRWNTLLSLQYVGVSGGFQEFPMVDQMASLASPSSANGTLRFVDANHNGLVDDGDRLDVLLPPTESPTAWDTYLLQVGVLGTLAPTYAAGVRYIVNGPAGPLVPLRSSRSTLVDFHYVGDRAGPPIASTVEVSGVPLGANPPVSDLQYTLMLENGAPASGPFATLPASPLPGVSLAFTDADHNGYLDTGDRVTLTGASNLTHVLLQVWAGGSAVGLIDWIVGYGEPARFVPNQSFATQGSGPWTITATVPTWSPELALNRTIRATLLENGQSVLTNVSLANGTIGSFTNGTLRFTDADGDGFLSTGDFFTLNGDPTASYELRISVLFAQTAAVFL